MSGATLYNWGSGLKVIKGTNTAAGKVARTNELPRRETAVKVLSAITTTAFAFLALTRFSSAQPATQEAPFCGTVAYDNNDLGVTVGFYTDTNIVPHGFLRFPNGHITSFDAPGAGLGYGLNQGTAAFAINDLGEIAGQLQDPSYVFHGFVR